jgi:hypothetical protein
MHFNNFRSPPNLGDAKLLELHCASQLRLRRTFITPRRASAPLSPSSAAVHRISSQLEWLSTLEIPPEAPTNGTDPRLLRKACCSLEQGEAADFALPDLHHCHHRLAALLFCLAQANGGTRPKDEQRRDAQEAAQLGHERRSVFRRATQASAHCAAVRMNFSHGSYEYHQSVIDNARAASSDVEGRPLGIALDTVRRCSCWQSAA